MFECLTGQAPFRRDTDAAVMYAHLSTPPPRLTELIADASPEFDRLFDRDEQGARRTASNRLGLHLGTKRALDLLSDARRSKLPPLNLAEASCSSASGSASPHSNEEASLAAPPSDATAGDRPTAAAQTAPSPGARASQPGDREQHRTKNPSALEGAPNDLDRRDRTTMDERRAAPPPAPATPQSRRRRPSNRALLTGCGVTVVGAAAVALLLSGGSEPKRVATGLISVAPATTNWSPAKPSEGVRGISSSQSMQSRGKDGLVVATIGTASNSASSAGGLPAGTDLTRPSPKGSLTNGVVDFNEFSGRSRKSGGAAVLYTAPTTAGDGLVYCAGSKPVPAAAVRTACRKLASTLVAAPGVTMLKLEPDTRFAKSMASILTQLNGSAARNGRGLDSGKLADRIVPARRLSSAYGDAAVRVSKLPAPVRQEAAIRAMAVQLNKLRSNFARLSAAARGKGAAAAAAYNRIVRSARANQAALSRLVASLRSRGYQVDRAGDDQQFMRQALRRRFVGSPDL